MDIISKRIGIVGGGQLGKMMILEAKRLGFYVVTLDPAGDCPSHSISDEHIAAGFDNPGAYIELAEKTDVITYEFEHIDAAVLDLLEKKGYTIYPSVESLKIIQNKYRQKRMLHDNGIPVPGFCLVESIGAIKRFAEKDSVGYPLMLKTTLGGYDGKGNALIYGDEDVKDAFQLLGGGKTELMAEEYVSFDKEVSIIACRAIDGTRVVYPVAENIHKDSILDVSIVPARIESPAQILVSEIAGRVMDVFAGVGAFCVEMFVKKNGDVFVNEVAPRPHNSGHYTIEGCFANQFENHIRAITGLPFGSTRLIQPTVMVNILGENNGAARLTGLDTAYSDPDVHVHFYGKSESRAGRKMGHITVIDDTVEGALRKAEMARKNVKVVGIFCLE